MLTILILVAVGGGWRAVRTAVESLRGLPQCNDDMISF
jgi:hypothetical protein